MAYFGNYIRSIIEAERKAGAGTNPKAMADRMGIKPSMMSRFLNSPKPIGCNPGTLSKMVQGISKDAAIRAGLRVAYLKDQLGDEAGMIEIKVRSSPRTEEGEGPWNHRGPNYHRLEVAAKTVGLDITSAEAIETIIKACAESPSFRRAMLNLAEIAEQDILKRK